MININRLNLDSSWFLELEGVRMVIDPWLIGSEIDGFKWLNEQWHIREPIAVEDLPEYDFLLISQSYEDHCHLETLKLIDPKKPILATRKAFHRLKKKFPEREIILIPNAGETLRYQGLTFTALEPDRKLDPVYFAVVISNERNDAVFYCPHGFALNQEQLAAFQHLNFRLLMTTFIYFRIPEIMGGLVNPGMDQVYQLVEQLRPGHILNTHDEKKKAKGLVSALAKIEYPDFVALESDERMNFSNLEDYSVLKISY